MRSPEENAAERAYYRANREKKLMQNKRWRSANAEKLWDARLQRLYGVDLGWYNAQLERQGGKCGICRSLKPGSRGRWCVDHDHVTGQVRGLLCRACNAMLGHAQDKLEVLQSGIEWVKHSGWTSFPV